MIAAGEEREGEKQAGPDRISELWIQAEPAREEIGERNPLRPERREVGYLVDSNGREGEEGAGGESGRVTEADIAGETPGEQTGEDPGEQAREIE